MGHFASDGVAIVVPAYLACAAMLLFLGMTAAIVAVRRGHVALFGGFALWSLAGSLLSFITCAYVQSENMAQGLRSLAWLGRAEALFAAATLVFIAVFSGARRRGWWAVGALAGLAVALALQAAWPAGARLATVEAAGWTLFSWGEFLFYVHGPVGPWSWLLFLGSVAMLSWAAWRALVLRYWGIRRSAAFLAVTVALLGAAFLHGALIDIADVRSFYTLPMAAVCAASLMGLRLTERLQDMRYDPPRSEDDRRRDADAMLEATGQHRVYAFSDPVTGLPNRMFVYDHLGALIHRGPPQCHGAVLLCVLAHYESSDRALTQAFADELVREVTLRLTGITQGRALVARTASDTFTAVVEGYAPDEDAAAENVEALARDVGAALSRPVRIGDYALTVMARMGMATFETWISSPHEVLARAQAALERARPSRKLHGRALLRIPRPEAPAA